MSRRIILSSGRKNRKGYRIPIEVIRFEDYLSNPVLLAEHDYEANVGHLEDLRIENGKLSGTPVFSSVPLGQQYKTLYEEKGINACSIGGFVLLNADRSEATDFELWEVSLVSVPADPGAVAELNSEPAAMSENTPETLSGISSEIMKQRIDAGYEYVTLNCMDETEESTQSVEDNGHSNISTMEDNINNAPETMGAETVQNAPETNSAPENAPKPEAAPETLNAPEPEKEPVKEPVKLGLNPQMPQAQQPSSKVNASRASLSALIKDKGIDGAIEMLRNGRDDEKLHVYEAIRNTPTGRVFMDALHLNINLGGADFRVKSEEYLRNRESLAAPLREVAKLGMNEAKLNASTDFIADPALDRIAFASMVFLKLFPTNLWVNRMPVLPVQMVGGNVGVVWANIGFDSKVTTSPAQTNTSVTAAAIVAKTDTPVSMAIYEHALEPMLFRRYNRDIVAYDQMGLQMDVAFNNLFTAMYDWDLSTLASNIAKQTVSKVVGTTGELFAPGSNWVKVPNNVTEYNGLTMADIQKIEAVFGAQGVNIQYMNPVINVDPALLYSLTQDPKVQTILTRFVSGSQGEDLRVNYSRVFSRQYLGVYDPGTRAVVNPATGTPTAAMEQYGLALIPEFILRGLASMEVYSKIEPTLYGEVYSAQIKTGIAPGYEDAKGTALIVPTPKGTE
jgi:hypothetical protein